MSWEGLCTERLGYMCGPVVRSAGREQWAMWRHRLSSTVVGYVNCRRHLGRRFGSFSIHFKCIYPLIQVPLLGLIL